VSTGLFRAPTPTSNGHERLRPAPVLRVDHLLHQTIARFAPATAGAKGSLVMGDLRKTSLLAKKAPLALPEHYSSADFSVRVKKALPWHYTKQTEDRQRALANLRAHHEPVTLETCGGLSPLLRLSL
jgi:hypothetical protein